MTENTQLRIDTEVRQEYGKLLDMWPDWPVHRDRDIICWKPTELGELLKPLVQLPTLWMAFSSQRLPLEELMRFYREIGYPLYLYLNLFGDLIGANMKQPEKELVTT